LNLRSHARHSLAVGVPPADLELTASGAFVWLAHSTGCVWAPAIATQTNIRIMPFISTGFAVNLPAHYIMERRGRRLGMDRTFGDGVRA
jgi:hypothetical protein